MKLTIPGILLPLCCVLQTHAQTPLNEVTVTASAMPVELRKISSSVSIIKSSDPEMKQLQTIDEALRYIPGVAVDRNRGLTTTGSHTTVTLRGTGSAGRTLILKDGIPLNDTYTGGVSLWNSIASNSISRIEVVRGPGSSIYGSSSMGGTINLVTENPRKQTTFGADVRYGSMNTRIVNVKGGKLFNNGFGIIAFVEYKKTDGYQYMADSLWKSYYQKPVMELLNANVKVMYQLNERSKLEGIVDLHTENPASGTSILYKEKNSVANFLLRYTGKNNWFDYSASAYYNHEKMNTDALNYNTEKGAFSTNYYTTNVPIDVTGFIGKISRKIGVNDLTIGGDIRLNKLSSEKYYYGKGNQNYSGNQNFYSLFINDDLSIGNSLNFNLGLRWDNWHNDNGKFFDNQSGTPTSIHYSNASSSVLSPKAGVVYRINDQFRLRALYAMGFKAPSMYYMYNSSLLGTTFRLGNPDLKPERMVYSVEAGADYTIGQVLEVSATAYTSRYKDFLDAVLIDASKVPSYFDPGSWAVRQYINIGAVRLSGIEASVRYKVAPYLTTILSYFYNDSKILKYESNKAYEGNEMDGNPHHRVDGGIAFSKAKLFDASLWVRYADKSYGDLENTKARELAATTVFDIRVAKQIAKFNVYANVLNLFDKLYYGYYGSATSYYYAPRRSFNVGVSYNL